jgi:SAM-dependent methyltransferase
MDHWGLHYAAREPISEPSTFARWCVREGWVAFADAVVDAGCGDGRDSAFFSSLGARVAAVDAAESAVRRVRARGLNVFCASMDALPLPLELFASRVPFGRVVAYSRFSLHAVPATVADAFFEWAARHADVLLVETRSVNDPRHGSGEPAGDGAFIDGHYRRFTRLNDLTAKLRDAGFRIEFAVVNRIVATR